MRCCLINREAWSGCAKLKLKCPRPISIGVIKEQSAKSQQSDECLIIEVFRDMQEGVADLGTGQATTDQDEDEAQPRQASSPLPSNITASDFSINSNLMKEANDTGTGTVAYPTLPNSPEVHDSMSGGLKGLKSELDSRASEGHPAASSGVFLPPMDSNAPANQLPHQGPGRDERIEELVDTLECPVCLDTADTAPIYQCPEGHLVCDDCNAKMVECPQCGHSLMNARNRTAEALALRLNQLRGDRVKSVMPSQAISVNVSNPQKVGKGLFSYVAYRIDTKIGHESSSKGEFTVYRRFKEFQLLHKKLLHNYSNSCLILPPPPNPSSAHPARTMLTGQVEQNGLAKYVGVRCRDLDRYLKRLARHPTLRKDPDFRIFLQEVKLSSSLEVKKGVGEMMNGLVEGIQNKTNRLTVTDTDIWFKTREMQQADLGKQMVQLQKDIKQMSKEKMSLFVSTTTFRRNLVSLLSSSSSGRERSSGGDRETSNSVMNRVAEFQNVMADLYLQQAEADEVLHHLASDYRLMLGSVERALNERRRALKLLQKETKRHSGAKDEDADKLNTAKADFDKKSQTLRRELAHFDTVMREEFSKTFDRYHQQYRDALANTGHSPKSD